MNRYASALCGLLLLAPQQHAQALSPAELLAIQVFRDHLQESMRGPQSPLNMVQLQQLEGGGTTVGSGAGNTVQLPHVAGSVIQVSFSGDDITVKAPPNGFPTGLTIGGKPATAETVRFDAGGTSPEFRQGSVSFVFRRKFGYWLVGRDMQAPAMLAFHTLHWYAPDARYRITAEWKPYPAPRVLRIANILGQVNDETSYGVAEFTLDGQTYQLEPSVDTARAQPLFFVFRDSTSRTTTYPAGRFLDAALPSNGLAQPGTVVLDFNRARNPWCAFSVHTSCPLPPQGNRLPVAISAGERRYSPETAHINLPEGRGPARWAVKEAPVNPR